nr:ribonucleotide reductase of class Ib [Raoultella sp. NCTC 9187]
MAAGNAASHAIGLGQMNLHGYLAREGIAYGSPEGLDFTNLYFYTVTWHALRTSMLMARERGERFAGFSRSRYASGDYFQQYLQGDWQPKNGESPRAVRPRRYRPARPPNVAAAARGRDALRDL